MNAIVTPSQSSDIFIMWDSVGKPLMKITVKTKRIKLQIGGLQFITARRLYHENEAVKSKTYKR